MKLTNILLALILIALIAIGIIAFQSWYNGLSNFDKCKWQHLTDDDAAAACRYRIVKNRIQRGYM